MRNGKRTGRFVLSCPAENYSHWGNGSGKTFLFFAFADSVSPETLVHAFCMKGHLNFENCAVSVFFWKKMKNLRNSLFRLLLAASFACSLFVFSGCMQPLGDEGEGSILGVWKSTYGEIYSISDSEFKNSYGDSETYTGNNLYVKPTSSSSGYIDFRYTRSMNPDYTYSETAADVGKWYAISYKNLTPSSVSISAAYGMQSSCSSIADAVSEFTIENNYFSFYSECEKETSFSGSITNVSQADETASVDKIVIATSYLRNFDGNYNLNSGWELNIGAKVNIHKDINHYWNANVVEPAYDNLNKTYSFYLVHSSQKDASGSIDPGITGSEPFISQQGLFWSKMTLKATSGSNWEIKWSSTWADSKDAANNLTLDMQDSFAGPENPKIKYSYKFYFGNPVKGSDDYYTVEKGDSIHSVEFEADLPIEKTWKQIYDDCGIASKLNIPEGKLADYWWYSTKSITGIKNSYVYPLTDSYKPSLTEYEFYLALKDKPALYTNPGKFYNASKGYLEITANTIQWNEDVYTIVDGAQWSEAGKSTTDPKLPFQYCYLVTDGTKNYYCLVEYCVNNNFTYNKFRTPKETSDTVCKTETENDFSLFTSYINSQLTVQDSSFWYEGFTDLSNHAWKITGGSKTTCSVSGESFTYSSLVKNADTVSFYNSSTLMLMLNYIESYGWTYVYQVEDEEESGYLTIQGFISDSDMNKILSHFE